MSGCLVRNPFIQQVMTIQYLLNNTMFARYRNFKKSWDAMNFNVRQTFLFTFLQSFARGIWMGNVLSAYIFFFTDGSYELLGLTSAAVGFAMTLIIFPAGYLADKFRRDRLLKFATITGIIGIIILMFATSLTMIFISLIFWGLTQGLVRPSLEALFADSVLSGDRSRIYSKKHLVQQWAMGVGPLVNVFLFLYLGDNWDLTILRGVMAIGLTISAFSMYPLLRFSDDKAIGRESEAIEIVTGEPEKGSSKVPILLLSSNLIVGIGAGMTIRYFPIFFLEIYDLKPISVQLIFALLFIMTGIGGIMAQKLSLKKGRPVMMFIVQSLAISCLFLIAFYPPLILLVPLFLLRGSLMNSAQPLSRSILMDYVHKINRGKWNSFEAIAWGLFWNFSAVIGGLILKYYSYRVTFIITGLVYVLGTLPVLMLIPIVRSETTTISDQKNRTQNLQNTKTFPSNPAN